MAIYFPSSPTLNEIYTFGGRSWQWNGYAWDVYSTVSGNVVTRLNGLTGGVTLAAGSNVTLTPAGNTITIASSAGGVTGATGSQGIQGVTGATGSQGIQGVTGVTGATGSQGIQGVTGATGATGAIPTNYVISFNGLTGAVTGVASIGGFTGTVTFSDGTYTTVRKSGNDISINNVGVQTLLITSGSGINALTGSGITGAITIGISNTGVTGIQAGTGISVSSTTGNPTITNIGVRSFNGLTGGVTLAAGSNVTLTPVGNTITIASSAGGATGATGSQGIQGVTGATGSQGIQGVTGATGATGSQGIQGVTGATGVNGTNGTNGNTGATGPQGNTGATGPVGDYVISFNGLTGAVTGVTVGGTNVFTALNTFNAGISAAGGTLSSIFNIPLAGITLQTVTSFGSERSIRISPTQLILGTSGTPSSNDVIKLNYSTIVDGSLIPSYYGVTPLRVKGPVSNTVSITDWLAGTTLVSSIMSSGGFSGPASNFSGLISANAGISAAGGVTLAGTFSGTTGSFSKLTTFDAGLSGDINISTTNVSGNVMYLLMARGTGVTGVFIDNVTTPLVYNPFLGNLGLRGITLTTGNNVLTIQPTQISATDTVTPSAGYFYFISTGGNYLQSPLLSQIGDIGAANSAMTLSVDPSTRVMTWSDGVYLTGVTSGFFGVNRNPYGMLSDYAVEINSPTGKGIQLMYNDYTGAVSNSVKMDVSSAGNYTITPSGGTASISGNLTVTGTLTGVTANFTGRVSSTVGFSGPGTNITGLVSSFNGLTGAVTGVTVGGTNVFTALNSFSSGLSASGGITFGSPISSTRMARHTSAVISAEKTADFSPTAEEDGTIFFVNAHSKSFLMITLDSLPIGWRAKFFNIGGSGVLFDSTGDIYGKGAENGLGNMVLDNSIMEVICYNTNTYFVG